MGAYVKQQGSLKLNEEQGLVLRENLKEGEEYPFEKKQHRMYQLDTPMELITSDWKVIARVAVTEITLGNNKTRGMYKVLKVYTDEEVEVVSGTLIPFKEVT